MADIRSIIITLFTRSIIMVKYVLYLGITGHIAIYSIIIYITAGKAIK